MYYVLERKDIKQVARDGVRRLMQHGSRARQQARQQSRAAGQSSKAEQSRAAPQGRAASKAAQQGNGGEWLKPLNTYMFC